ncbi:MAG: DUF3596 domain-containing protein [Cyanobacteria bacterium J06641_5]
MSVAVYNNHGRLCLRLSWGGKRPKLSLGLPDTPDNRAHAQMKAAELKFAMQSLGCNLDA